ncbi:MAG: DUF502 domain-containing protein [Planctomycetaceae bacterium]|nr:DUF502 domain-containing protein [Planctomycetaceae bacterium]
MERFRRHIAKCLVAGVVALLPIGGLLLTVYYFENQVAGVWLKNQGFYFFGLGLLLATISLYLIGLIVSSLLGRWLFYQADRLLDRMPVLGNLYQTLKQLIGYGEGPQGMFKRVVWVSRDDAKQFELGLVTMEASPASQDRLAVFVPSGPSPTTGRLLYLERDRLIETNLTVNEALQILVSLGSLVLDKPLMLPSKQTC